MSASSTSINNFQKFTFDKDPRWKTYLKDLDPKFQDKNLEKKKRIWYRNHIDENFDVFFDADDDNDDDNNKQSKKSGSSDDSIFSFLQLSTQFKEGLYNVEGFFKIGYFVSIFTPIVSRSWNQIILCCICFSGMVRQMGGIQFSKVYVKKLIGNEFLWDLVYALIVLLLWKKSSQLVLYPISLHFLIGISEFVAIKPEYFESYLENPSFKRIINIPRTYKETVMQAKCTIELAFMTYAILFYCLDQLDPMDILIYLGFLVVKLVCNKNMQSTLGKIGKKPKAKTE